MTHDLPRRAPVLLKDFAQGIERLLAAKRDLIGFDQSNAVAAHDVAGNTLGEGRRVVIVKAMLRAPSAFTMMFPVSWPSSRR
jgi:hypothetical protein